MGFSDFQPQKRNKTYKKDYLTKTSIQLAPGASNTNLFKARSSPGN